jgi:hypothetical protein
MSFRARGVAVVGVLGRDLRLNETATSSLRSGPGVDKPVSGRECFGDDGYDLLFGWAEIDVRHGEEGTASRPA